MKNILIATAALIALANLPGCALVMAGSGYHNDHGDLVSSDGSVRYIGWCNVHPHFSHCLLPRSSTAVADAGGALPAG